MASPSDLPPDQKAIMPDGVSFFSFFDTGAPGGTTAYVTYLLIHGLCFTKATWRDMVKGRDTAARIRLVAFSLRGYDNCSPFEEAADDYMIGPSIGKDFSDMVTYVAQKLLVLANQGSTLTVIGWSLAAASIVAAYGIIDTSAPLPQWTTYISNIVFYEPSGGRAFGLDNWAALNPNPPANPPTVGIEIFKRAAANFYGYDDAFYDRPCPTGVHDPRDVATITSCLIDTDINSWNTKCIIGIFEPGPFLKYARLTYSPIPQGVTDAANRKNYATKALTTMANTGVKTIHGISSRNTLTGCTIAIKWLESVVTLATPNKWYMTWIPGENNHFVHNLNVGLFWDAVNLAKP